MKLRPILLAVVLMAAVGGPVWAATANGPLATPADPEESTTMAQRLASRRSQLKLTLSAAEEQRISSRCALAQTALTNTRKADMEARGQRTTTYSDLAGGLSTIISNLERQNISAEALKASQAKLDSDMNKYLTDSLQYKTAMDDLVNINCAADPTGFKASLLSARQLRNRLATDAAAVKAAVPQVISDLETAKQALINSGGTTSGNQ